MLAVLRQAVSDVVPATLLQCEDVRAGIWKRPPCSWQHPHGIVVFLFIFWLSSPLFSSSSTLSSLSQPTTPSSRLPSCPQSSSPAMLLVQLSILLLLILRLFPSRPTACAAAADVFDSDVQAPCFFSPSFFLYPFLSSSSSSASRSSLFPYFFLSFLLLAVVNCARAQADAVGLAVIAHEDGAAARAAEAAPRQRTRPTHDELSARARAALRRSQRTSAAATSAKIVKAVPPLALQHARQ